MYKAVFTIGEYPKAYIGYTSGRLWNGWATPYFELEEAKRVAEGFNECAENPMQYDEVYDQFYILDKESGELEKWVGEDIQTTEGIKHLYGIGAYSWVWDEATEEDCNFLTDVIEDFIYEFDTYEYRDVGVDREEMIEAIKYQLKELKIFQQVYEIWHNEDLSQDERFEELKKILFV
jgi:hypothetical protein